MPIEYGVKLSKYDEGKSVNPTFFKSLVRRLCYLTCTILDVFYAIGLVSRCMKTLKTIKAAKESFANQRYN